MKNNNDNFKGNILRLQVLSIKYYRGGINDYTITCKIVVFNPFIQSVQSFKGTAKCNPEDTMSIKKGKHIAESRAKLLMFKTVQQTIVDVLSDTQNKYFNLEMHELNHIKNLIEA